LVQRRSRNASNDNYLIVGNYFVVGNFYFC